MYVGVGALGGYLLMGTKKGKKQTARLEKWAMTMKKDVIKKMNQAKKFDKSDYIDAVDTVADTYTREGKAKAEELKGAVKQLKRHWNTIQKEIEQASDEIIDSIEGTGKKKGDRKKSAKKK